MKKIVVAITGASGSIYARLLLERLLRSEEISQVAVIFSDYGRQVAEYEGEYDAIVGFATHKMKIFEPTDMFAAPASGSANYDAMVIIPASMGSVGRVANGVSRGLIERAADVMIKERRKLIVVPREAPMSTIHLRNLVTLSECGVVVLPASPSMYSKPETIEQFCDTVVERVMVQLGVETERFSWGER